MEVIRSKPAFPRKATGNTRVFQERQKVNQQIAGADKNIDIKTRRSCHRRAQFYISNELIFNNFLGGVYMRKLAPARVSYQHDVLISCRVYMMTGSFHISLFEDTLHVDKMHV